MKRLYLYALCVLLGLLLAGCGGGGSRTGGRGTARVTLKITVPDVVRAKLAAAIASAPGKAAGGAGGRLIPSNAQDVIITYNNITDPNVHNVTPGTVTPHPTVASLTNPVVISDLTAGVANTIIVTMRDSNGALVAGASATVNVAPGSDATSSGNQINIVMQSTVTGNVTFSVDGGAESNAVTIADSNTHTIKAILHTNEATPTAVTSAIPAANLAFQLPDSLQLVSPNTTVSPYTITVRLLKSTSGGTVPVNLIYTETPTTGQSQVIKTGALDVTLRAVLTGVTPTTPLVDANSAAIPNTSAYDVSGDGYALFYDTVLVIPTVDAAAGYSRITSPLASPAIADLADFDLDATAMAPTRFVSTGSRLTSFGTTQVVVRQDGTEVSALTAGTQSRYTTGAAGAFWNHAPVANYTIIDADAKDTSVYLLEKSTTGSSYVIERIKQADGTQISVTQVGDPGFMLNSLAVVPPVAPATTTSYYLGGGSQVARLTVNGTSQTLTPGFAAFGAATVIDIATDAGDTRYVYALTSTGVALVLAADGTQIQLGATTPFSGVQTLNATGVSLSASGGSATVGSSIYVLENNINLAQIEKFVLQ